MLMRSSLKRKERAPEDGLFLERLETLFDKSLSDLQAFAQREARPFDEVRRHVAEWHSAHLFESSPPTRDAPVQERLNTILRHVSQTLESLHEVAGLESFFLVVNPRDSADEGFLGGTVTGREFWRSHRGCGAAGAKAFQTQCKKVSENHSTSSTPIPPPMFVNIPQRKKGPAASLKGEVYTEIRNALRTASGIRNAEMKWKDHAKLHPYGVCLEGWPPDVPKQNPSALSVAQNRQILEALNGGTLFFTPLTGASSAVIDPHLDDCDRADNDFSWACRYSDEPAGISTHGASCGDQIVNAIANDPPIHPQPTSVASTPSSSHGSDGVDKDVEDQRPSKRPREDEGG